MSLMLSSLYAKEMKKRIRIIFSLEFKDMALSTQVLTWNPGKQTNLHFGAIALDKEGTILSRLTPGSW